MKTLLAAACAFACASLCVAAGPPPSDTSAAEAIKSSPRHGEWIEVALPKSAPDAPEVKIKTWVVYPERAEKAPVVLVIHEIFGLTDWVRSNADALAAEGFIAVAPDLLSGLGPNGGGTDSLDGDKAREAIRKLTPADTAARLNAVRAAALALPSASGKSACIGFCWGGSSSFSYAAATPEFAGKPLPPLNGAVVYYGTAPTDRAVLEKVACPVVGFYGGDDARVTSTVDATTAAMKELNKTFAAHTYAGAGHGFLRQQSGRDGANLAAAEKSWEETIKFLKARTAPQSPAPAAKPATPGKPASPPAPPAAPEAPASPTPPAAPKSPR